VLATAGKSAVPASCFMISNSSICFCIRLPAPLLLIVSAAKFPKLMRHLFTLSELAIQSSFVFGE